jgi:hypothetical protein
MACIALGHDASNDPVDGSKLAAMNDLPDAHEQQIIRSWNSNAKPWTQAIQTQSIQSRRRVTDRAIVDAVSARRRLN